jgi:hypothetical protein
MGNIRKSHTARDKLKIITYAEAHGNRAAGREYVVGESNIRLWRKQKERLKKLPRSVCNNNISNNSPQALQCLTI